MEHEHTNATLNRQPANTLVSGKCSDSFSGHHTEQPTPQQHQCEAHPPEQDKSEELFARTATAEEETAADAGMAHSPQVEELNTETGKSEAAQG